MRPRFVISRTSTLILNEVKGKGRRTRDLVTLLLLLFWAAPAVFAFDPSEIPDFSADPSRPRAMTVKDGPWDSPSTWDMGRVPGPDDIARIHHHVTLRTPDAICYTLAIHGKLSFDPTVNTRLTVVNLLVMMGDSSMPPGELEIGTAARPISPNVTAQILIRDQPLDITDDGVGIFDPKQFGTGLIGMGTVTMHGSPRAPAFVRLATEPRAGDKTLALSEPVAGWLPGDRLILPDTRHLTETERGDSQNPFSPQWEELILANVSADGTILTLTSAMQFDHVGARNGDDVLEFLPHVGNLTRNVVVKSKNPAGTRGHVLFTHRAQVKVYGTHFRDLGRTTNDPPDDTTFDSQGQVTHIGTNQRGRYSLHAHHLMGPVNPTNQGYQYEWVGNAVTDAAPSKWPIVVHNSHYGLIQGNVVYNSLGWGIGTEDGNESYNLFEKNFVVRIRGNGNDRNNDGRDGSGFWFAGFNHLLRDNVAANATDSFGYNFVTGAAASKTTRIPKFRGADLSKDGEYELVDMQAVPIPEFARNEVYGATPKGLEIWQLGCCGYRSQNIEETLIKDFRVWHIWDRGFYGYPAGHITFDGFVVRGDKRAETSYGGTALSWGDYEIRDLTIRRADIQSMRSGIGSILDAPGTTLIEDSYFRNFNSGIAMTTPQTPGTGSGIAPRKTIIRNCRFDPLPGKTLQAIAMSYNLGHGRTNVIQKDQVFVEDYQGIKGNNFRLFYFQQHPDFIVPEQDLTRDTTGSPVAGLTNTQSLAAYGIAVAGEIATCTSTKMPELYGLACTPQDAPAQAPVIFQPNVTLLPGQNNTFDALFEWYTNTPSDSTVADAYFGNLPSVADPTPRTFHSLTVRGLQRAANPFYYQLKSKNAAGEAVYTGPNTFFNVPDPTGDTIPPQLSEIRSAARNGTATIAWLTSNEGSTSQVEYGLDATYGEKTPIVLRLVATHIVNLTNLTMGKTYHFRVHSKDPAGNSAVSGDFTFVTNQPPVVDAGEDQTITLPDSATLRGTVTDDGLPNPPGRITQVNWGVVSSPKDGEVRFGDDASISTSASFSKPGTYVLYLSASDGGDGASDTLTITVNPSDTPPLCGDLNNDGQVTLGDVKHGVDGLLGKVAVPGSTDPRFRVWDLNRNGQFDLRDLLRIVNHLLGKPDQFPPEGCS